MYDRILKNPTSSFFLFGPRGTGKSTWLKSRFSTASFYDLLDTPTMRRLNRNPEVLYEEVIAGNPDWVVLDEIQRVPSILNEVHRLIEETQTKFALSGSSTRKIRQAGVNLLAGRARMRTMFPLTSFELGSDFDINHILRYGSLPMTFDDESPSDYLRSYADNYLTQEIELEAQVRDIGAFDRFLDVAARQNSEATNVASISRDVEVARTTVRSYFKILEDTLIANWLPAWKLKPANKQKMQSKFYFFDCGIVRALSSRLSYEPTPEERGSLFESLVFNELRAYMTYRDLHYPLYYFRTYDGVEVDFLFETNKGFVVIETKSSGRWERRFNRGLHKVAEILKTKKVEKLGVFNGPRQLQVEDVRVLPIKDFLRILWSDELVINKDSS